MMLSKRWVLATLIWASLCVLARGQSGQISGTARDPSLAALFHAQITVTNQSTGVTREVSSNRLGYYSVAFVSPGEYTVRAEAAGFKTIVHKSLAV